MASAASVLPPQPHMMLHPIPPKHASFSGDGEGLLDALLAACQAKHANPANPSLFGRDLQPYTFDEPMPAAKSVTKPASSARKENRRGAGAQPAMAATPAPQAATRGRTPKKASEAGAKRSRVTSTKTDTAAGSPAPRSTRAPAAAGHVTPARRSRSPSPDAGFAGPGFCNSPQPELLPLPPATLLRRA